jgi:acetyl esterase/lipase
LVERREIDAIRAMLAAKPRPIGWAERRQRIEEVGSAWPVATDIRLEPVRFEHFSAEWSIAPDSDAGRVLIYFHGGGYCSGSLKSHRRLVTEAGRAAGMRTFAVQYRLAPEHPFPAAADDALAAWHFLRDQGYAAKNIVVGGDSAGGGLTLCLFQRLLAAGEALPACGWLLSPWTDLTMSGATMASRDAVDPLIHRAYLEDLAAAYAPPGIDRRNPLVSPLYANLAGMPPLLIQVGSDETLLSDATRLAEAAGIAEVAVRLEVWPAMIHAFPLWNGGLEAGRRALAEAGAFMRASMGGN